MSFKYADVESEYSKDHKIRKEDVGILLDWIQKQPHLPKISEFKVILFLQSCYYRIECAKISIENYYTVRAHAPELFANRNIAAVQHPMKISAAFLLPKPSLKGYSVMLAKLVDPNLDDFNCNDLIKYFDMAVSLVFREIGTSAGHVLVVDMEGTSFGHIAKVNITSARKYVYLLQEAMPIRVKEIHIVNVSAMAQKLISLIKPFLKNEILDMIQIHGALDGLFDYVPKEALPREYGGQAGSIDEIMAKQRKEFEASKEYFSEEEKEIADESKRIGKPKNVHDIFGVEGTFKKLNID